MRLRRSESKRRKYWRRVNSGKIKPCTHDLRGRGGKICQKCGRRR